MTVIPEHFGIQTLFLIKTQQIIAEVKELKRNESIKNL